MTNFINAIYHPELLTVEYIDANGDHLFRSGGTIAWRFNNPGNLRPGSKYTLHISKGQTKSGSFLIFPTAESGRAEKKGLLLRKYKDDTVAQMMELYAPRTENDTDKYISYITTKSKIGKDAVVGKLSAADLDSLMQAMERFEGYYAQEETRKEKWVRTTKITLSDGAAPIAGKVITVRQGKETTQVTTDAQGRLPTITHNKPGEKVELWTKNHTDELELIESILLGATSLALTYVNRYLIVKAITSQLFSTSKPKEKKPEPFSYVVQPGDTLGKIAKKIQNEPRRYTERQ